MTTAQTQIAEGTQNVAEAAAPADTRSKQEILRDTLTAATPNADGKRVAVVTKDGETYQATFAGIVIASVKRVEDIAGLLIDHRFTQKAKWASVDELKFECDVPEGTPFKAGMKKSNGKFAQLAASVIAKIDGLDIAKADKKSVVALLIEVQSDLTAAVK